MIIASWACRSVRSRCIAGRCFSAYRLAVVIAVVVAGISGVVSIAATSRIDGISGFIHSILVAIYILIGHLKIGIPWFRHVCTASFTLVGLCDKILSAIFFTHDTLNTTRHVDRVTSGGASTRNETVEGSARVEGNVGSIRVSLDQVRKSTHRSIFIIVVTARKSLRSCEPTFNAVIGLNGHTLSKALGIFIRFCRRAKCLRDDLKIFSSGLGFCNDLLRCLGCIGRSGISTRTSPSSLTSGENSVNHVEPVEKRIDDEHKGIEPRLETSQTNTEIEHEGPIETEGHSNETNRELFDFLGGGNERKNENKEQESCGTNGVLHEADNAENRVSPPKTDISQHANFVGDKTQEPSASLLQQTLVRCDCLGFTESSRTHLNLVSFLCANHEKMSKPSILAQMTLSIVEKIVTLFSFVGEVVLGHLSESRETQDCKRSRKTGD